MVIVKKGPMDSSLYDLRQGKTNVVKTLSSGDYCGLSVVDPDEAAIAVQW